MKKRILAYLSAAVLSLSLLAGCSQDIGSVYSDTEEEITIEAGILKYRAKEKFKAVAVELT